MSVIGHQVYTLAIPAGGEEIIHSQGRFVGCLESDQNSFEIALDDGAFVHFEAGLKTRIADDQTTF